MAERDFTSGSEIRHIVFFGIPVMGGNILMQLYNYVDSIIVGNYIGKQALAAVGAASPFIFMLVSLVIGVSIGSTILIAQRYGRKDIKGVRTATDTLLIFLVAAALLLTIIGIKFSGAILDLVGLPEDVMPYAQEYLDIYLLSLIFLFIFNSLSAAMRGVGDSRTPLLFLGVASLLNLALDLILVIAFDMGIKGVAWASVVAQGVAVAFALIYTNRRSKIIKIDLLRLKFSRSSFIKQMKLGLPASLQQLSLSIGMLAIFSIITNFGTDVVAAYSAASRIETLIFVLPMAMSMALTNFVGQNYGASRMDRIDRGVKESLKIGYVMSFTILILISALARPMMMLFFSDEETILIGCNYLLVLSVSFPIFYTMYVLMGAMRGVGNTVIPMIITLLSLWIIRVPVAEILSCYIGELGIWIASPISWAIGLVAAIISYRHIKKRWVTSIKPTPLPAPSTNEE